MSNVIVIRPRRSWWDFGFAELWESRGILTNLATREILVRYKQTLLGAAWAVIQPFTTMVIFTIFFGRLAGLDRQTGDIPYPLFAFAALVPWYYFAHAIGGVSNCLIENRNLIAKVYFPRLILPLAPLLSGLVDFTLSLLVLGGLMAWYRVAPSAGLVALPALVLLMMMAALALGLWLAALNAQFRDFRYAIPFLINIWFFASPIAYPTGLIRNPTLKALYGLNPMAGVVEAFRWALLGTGRAPGAMLWVSSAVLFLLLLGGTAFFRQVERSIVDVV